MLGLLGSHYFQKVDELVVVRLFGSLLDVHEDVHQVVERNGRYQVEDQ